MRDNSIPMSSDDGDVDSVCLPCLNSNISTEIPLSRPLVSGQSQYSANCLPSKTTPFERLSSAYEEELFRKIRKLSTQHKKSAFVLKESIHKISFEYGIEYLGFLTLTFSEHITCPKEAQKRLNSLLSHVIKRRYREYVGVMERQKSGRIHYHLLVVLNYDIRTGFDWDEVAKGNYSSAGFELRREWAFWRRTSKSYRFGRTELLPVKTNVEAMAKYVGKYIGKAIEARNPDDKGVRLVRYSRGARAGTTRFQFHCDGSSEWRRKVATFAALVQTYCPEEKITELEDLSRLLGKRWAYYHRQSILALP